MYVKVRVNLVLSCQCNTHRKIDVFRTKLSCCSSVLVLDPSIYVTNNNNWYRYATLCTYLCVIGSQSTRFLFTVYFENLEKKVTWSSSSSFLNTFIHDRYTTALILVKFIRLFGKNCWVGLLILICFVSCYTF